MTTVRHAGDASRLVNASDSGTQYSSNYGRLQKIKAREAIVVIDLVEALRNSAGRQTLGRARKEPAAGE